MQYFRRLYAYERDSNAKSLDSVETIPVDRRADGAYQRALDLHAHLAMSRQMWLFRLGGDATPPQTFHPENLSLEDVRALVRRTEQQWSAFLAQVPDDDVDTTIEYEGLASGRFRSRLGDIFTHLAAHTLHHRGQMAALVRSAGGQPANTDYMFWSRTRLEA